MRLIRRPQPRFRVDVMLLNRRLKVHFSLASTFVLMLGVGIGFTLKTVSLWHWFGPPNEAHMDSLPRYTIEPPDILTIDVHSNSPNGLPVTPVQHLVAPDGRVNLGVYGQVYVAGLTLEHARMAVERHLSKYLDTPTAAVDVFACNSKTFYVITQGANRDEVAQFRITGNETALDGLAQFGGLKAPNTAKVFIARPAPNGVGSDAILPIDLDRIAKGFSDTNYQLLPRDRLYISQASAAGTSN
jgi:protein involved in polysaccharide export with SLBB domain